MSQLFGLISQYLEGRRFTEIMVSALSASLMLGGPFARYLTQLLKENDVALGFIPLIIGGMFLPICVIAMVVLDTVPPPTRLDANNRAERR